MRSLEGTSLEGAYYVFGVMDDDELCTTMTNLGLIYTIVVGLHSIFRPAPYGRHSESNVGPAINAKLGWMVQECMAIIFPAIIIAITPGEQLRSYANITAISLFCLHYFHRSFIYPFAMSSDSKPTPIITVIGALVFCTYNGFLQGMHLVNVYHVKDSVNVFIGTTIFLAGMGVNVIHDRILISLREETKKESEASSSSTDTEEGSSKKRYKMPRGGLFEYVSCANYLGEIMEWLGLAVITLGYPQMVFALFTLTFLANRAIHHHRFYHKVFGDAYPKSRKAIIPFLL